MTDFHFQHFLLGKHIVIETDQCNDQERLKICIVKCYVLEWLSNSLIEILILPSYHRPLGGDKCGWKNEKSLTCFVTHTSTNINMMENKSQPKLLSRNQRDYNGQDIEKLWRDQIHCPHWSNTHTRGRVNRLRFKSFQFTIFIFWDSNVCYKI